MSFMNVVVHLSSTPAQRCYALLETSGDHVLSTSDVDPQLFELTMSTR